MWFTLRSTNYMRRWIALILFFPIAEIASGQDFRQVAEKMQEDFTNSKSLHVVMRVNVYENDRQADPVYSQRAEITRLDGNYLYLLNENEMLMNKGFIIMVDHQRRVIRMTSRDVTNEKEFERKTIDIDSIFNYINAAEYLGIKEGKSQYRMKLKDGEIEQVDLSFVNNEILSQINYLYKAGQIARVDFEIFDTVSKPDENIFSELRFISFNKKKPVPADLYKNYTLQ
jgi:hypothetical protein